MLQNFQQQVVKPEANAQLPPSTAQTAAQSVPTGLAAAAPQPPVPSPQPPPPTHHAQPVQQKSTFDTVTVFIVIEGFVVSYTTKSNYIVVFFLFSMDTNIYQNLELVDAMTFFSFCKMNIRKPTFLFIPPLCNKHRTTDYVLHWSVSL